MCSTMPAHTRPQTISPCWQWATIQKRPPEYTPGLHAGCISKRCVHLRAPLFFMQLTVNGNPTDLPDSSTVAALLDHLGLSGKPVVVELNQRALFPRELAST